ncbi:MAG: cysteine--tRNA ligase [Candidatus Micrarchaeota archaeon]|nr:MAG: cysteine--tRNA ligase [Candidatus Micrarchaeota archaeon]
MYLYNTLTKKIEKVDPLEDNAIRIYSCGPTVYYYPHIGNMRSYIDVDILVKTLKHYGFKVKRVMNITDVGHLVGDAEEGEDKLRKEAEEENKTVREIADYYTSIFLRYLDLLNIEKPDIMPRASDHINDILDAIKILDQKGYAYKIDKGVYFDTSKINDYGVLIGKSFEELNRELKAGARVERPEGIRNITDFALWRNVKVKQEMTWDSEYGLGFPGWHIECSVMSTKYLGKQFDIHTGGVDHIPVHHTNEIAQSEGLNGVIPAKIWFHVAFLKVENQKMSKSLRNIYTIDDLISRGYNPLAYRYLVLTSHYRSELNFTFKAMDDAQNTLNNLYATLSLVNWIAHGSYNADNKDEKSIEDHYKKAIGYLYNDLDTPDALREMHSIISILNDLTSKKALSSELAKTAIRYLLDIDSIFSIGFTQLIDKLNSLYNNDELISLIKERDQLRASKRFNEADSIRESIAKRFNVKLSDTNYGTIIAL